jgi:hypothetical protein
MATVIQIKRSTGATAPGVSDLAEGELAYVQDRSNDGASAKLYIESVDSGSSAVIHEIGGKYYTDIIDGDAPTPSNFVVGNGATAGASIQLREDSDNGSNFVALKAADSIGSNLTLTLPSSDGSNGQVLGTNGSGVCLSFQQLHQLQVHLIQISQVLHQDKFLFTMVQTHLIMSQYQEMLLSLQMVL